jgi:hypothetical protein
MTSAISRACFSPGIFTRCPPRVLKPEKNTTIPVCRPVASTMRNVLGHSSVRKGLAKAMRSSAWPEVRPRLRRAQACAFGASGLMVLSRLA